ncbi:MAG: hypothetical protein C6Y22_19910 [Hapalosiphonaceae cyanobacterium JJU2]|nr:MAG: hypothetical protein C6Y22_19910 [Hapalosiphonaceae cyanobacterium JJU2]
MQAYFSIKKKSPKSSPELKQKAISTPNKNYLGFADLKAAPGFEPGDGGFADRYPTFKRLTGKRFEKIKLKCNKFCSKLKNFRTLEKVIILKAKIRYIYWIVSLHANNNPN